jgi:hypothetical protein
MPEHSNQSPAAGLESDINPPAGEFATGSVGPPGDGGRY